MKWIATAVLREDCEPLCREFTVIAFADSKAEAVRELRREAWKKIPGGYGDEEIYLSHVMPARGQ